MAEGNETKFYIVFVEPANIENLPNEIIRVIKDAQIIFFHQKDPSLNPVFEWSKIGSYKLLNLNSPDISDELTKITAKTDADLVYLSTSDLGSIKEALKLCKILSNLNLDYEILWSTNDWKSILVKCGVFPTDQALHRGLLYCEMIGGNFSSVAQIIRNFDSSTVAVFKILNNDLPMLVQLFKDTSPSFSISFVSDRGDIVQAHDVTSSSSGMNNKIKSDSYIYCLAGNEWEEIEIIKTQKHHTLKDLRIVVTRPRNLLYNFSQALRKRGAQVIQIPVLRREKPKKESIVKEALTGLNSYDWIVFTSVNSVESFFESFFNMFNDLRDIGGVKIAAVGPATAKRIKDFKLNVDVSPVKDFSGKSIVEELAKYESLENLRILLPRSESANPDLCQLLEEKGAIVDDIAFYRMVPETHDSFNTWEDFKKYGADWITFTSGQTAVCFNERFDLNSLKKKFPKIKIASLGHETSKSLREIGIEPDVESETQTIEALIKAIEKNIASNIS